MSHGFYVSAGLLTVDHARRIGPALWEFLWLISHETPEEGKVLNGAPITLKRIAVDLGEKERTAGKNLVRLESAGYITRHRTVGNSYEYQIANSKKWRKVGCESSDIRPKKEVHTSQKGRTNKESRQLDRIDRVDTPEPTSVSSNRRSTQTGIPDNFQITEQLRVWAAEKGYQDLEAHFENFIGTAKAKGYRYADWTQAFQNAVRQDWAQLKQGRKGNANRAERRQNSNLAARETVRASIMAGG
jgi:hypothetical protein